MGRLAFGTVAQERVVDPIQQAIYTNGYALVPNAVSCVDADAIQGFWHNQNFFRSEINMDRYRFGSGTYRYFANPLPEIIQSLRRCLYDQVIHCANQMMQDTRSAMEYPAEFSAFTAQCHAAGQCKPTPLLLRYEKGGYNRLHRDLYGPLHFPLQATILLSEPETAFTGGAFMLVEQHPRQQSIGRVVPLNRGDMVIFPVFDRPVPGRRGFFKAPIRHGVSQILSGERFALGLILHDAA